MIHLHHHKYGYVKYIYILYVTKVIYGNIIILTCTFEICMYDNMIVQIRVLLHFGLNSQLVKFNLMFHPSRVPTVHFGDQGNADVLSPCPLRYLIRVSEREC